MTTPRRPAGDFDGLHASYVAWWAAWALSGIPILAIYLDGRLPGWVLVAHVLWLVVLEAIGGFVRTKGGDTLSEVMRRVRDWAGPNARPYQSWSALVTAFEFLFAVEIAVLFPVWWVSIPVGALVFGFVHFHWHYREFG